MIARVKGTQDFLDVSVRNFVLDSAFEYLTLAHFSQIETPILESVDLFKRALGDHTDVVSKEMFVIDPHEGSSETICLRPEATASTTRAFLQDGQQDTPWKIFSYGPMFRYERPQKGRYRQFSHLNIEIIGAQSIVHDVQLITLLDRFFSETLKLDSYALLINFLGCIDDRREYRTKLHAFLEIQVTGLCPTCAVRKDTNIMRVFDCKNEQCQELYKKAPFIADHLCAVCDVEWQQVQNQLSLLSVSYAYNPKLVRGLDYYNKTVFEFSSHNLGAQTAFCGGGRYELATQFGAKHPVPSIGAAIGMERLLLLLEPLRDQLPLAPLPRLHVIMPMAPAQHALALLVADMLHAQSICADVLVDADSVKNMMRKANKMGAVYALILGEDEQANGTVTVKNMITGQQETVLHIELVAYLKK